MSIKGTKRILFIMYVAAIIDCRAISMDRSHDVKQFRRMEGLEDQCNGPDSKRPEIPHAEQKPLYSSLPVLSVTDGISARLHDLSAPATPKSAWA